MWSKIRHGAKLTAQTRDALQFVALGYGDNRGFRSLNFRTEKLNTDQTQAVVRLVKEYNQFDGAAVAAAIEQFRGRISGYEFGREGSPVLYIELPYWTSQAEAHAVQAAEAGPGRRIEDAERDALIEEMRVVFVDRLKADEFDIEEIGDRRLRVWWD
jgi:hypothetical protein